MRWRTEGLSRASEGSRTPNPPTVSASASHDESFNPPPRYPMAGLGHPGQHRRGTATRCRPPSRTSALPSHPPNLNKVSKQLIARSHKQITVAPVSTVIYTNSCYFKEFWPPNSLSLLWTHPCVGWIKSVCNCQQTCKVSFLFYSSTVRTFFRDDFCAPTVCVWLILHFPHFFKYILPPSQNVSIFSYESRQLCVQVHS